MTRLLEGIISVDPLVVRRRVRWGDCDPAQVVYTPQFGHYAVETILVFFDEIIGRPSWRLEGKGRLGLPMKALSLEFVHFLVTNDEVDLTVYVGELRQRTFDLHIVGTCRGQVSFRAKGTPIVTDMQAHTAALMPDDLRATLTAYATRNPLAP